MELAELRDRASRILDEVERAIVGKRDALELILIAVLCDGHVLLEDYPGLAKTLTARSFAQATTLRFSRIQFTPDLMPSDVTGSSVFDQRGAEFTFLPGPIFTNLLLADEINRAPPKTQAALLEAMQERQVTTEGETRVLERPFVDRVQSDERPRGYRRSGSAQVDLLVPGMPEHFIARMRGLWLPYPDGSVVTAREAGSAPQPPQAVFVPEAAESLPSVLDPAIRRATLAISDETAGGRPLVRSHPPIAGDRADDVPAHRTDCGWLV